jgi:hypothetical protein
MKHATSAFNKYLIKDRVHTNYAQLGPEEAVVLGWIPGSHPAFSFRDNMREAIKDQTPIEYTNVEWALFPKTIYYTRASDGAKLSTSGVSLQVNKQAADQLYSNCEDIAKMWQKVSPLKGGPLVGKHLVPFGKSGDVDSNHSSYKFENEKTVWDNSPEAINERSIYRHRGGNINGLEPFGEHPDMICGLQNLGKLQVGGISLIETNVE